MDEFDLRGDHRRWAKSARRKYRRSLRYWLDLIAKQRGLCAFSGVPLRFDSQSGTPKKGGPGVHPIYAAVDHCSPGCDDGGHEIVSYDLNDLKGHLPLDCFLELKAAGAWQHLMDKWREQARLNPDDRDAFRRIRRAATVRV